MYHLRSSQGVGAGLGADSILVTFSAVGQGVVTTSLKAGPLDTELGAEREDSKTKVKGYPMNIFRQINNGHLMSRYLTLTQ
jgi:hypothetical protein